jgi:sugar lactone lactonase YvrE
LSIYAEELDHPEALPFIRMKQRGAGGEAGQIYGVDNGGKIFVRELLHVPDGVAFEIESNPYSSCYSPSRIYRIVRDRAVQVVVEDPTSHILSNCATIAFGGADFKSLYVANLGRWHVMHFNTPFRGANLACHLSAVESA